MKPHVMIFVQVPSLPGQPGVFRAEVEHPNGRKSCGFGFTPQQAEDDALQREVVVYAARGNEPLWAACMEFLGRIEVQMTRRGLGAVFHEGSMPS